MGLKVRELLGKRKKMVVCGFIQPPTCGSTPVSFGEAFQYLPRSSRLEESVFSPEREV